MCRAPEDLSLASQPPRRPTRPPLCSCRQPGPSLPEVSEGYAAMASERGAHDGMGSAQCSLQLQARLVIECTDDLGLGDGNGHALGGSNFRK